MLEDLTGLSLDLSRLAEDAASSDLVFITGEEETRHCAHILVWNLRCQRLMSLVSSGTQRLEEGRTLVRLPTTPTPAFTDFKNFVYSGKVKMDNMNIFLLIRLAEDFGVQSLEALSHDYVASSLTLSSSLDLLNNWVDVVPSHANPDSNAVKQIFTFIKDNLAQLRERKLIKTMSKPALIRLIRSRSLSLDENEVWRLAVDWAKLQTGLEDLQHAPKLWTEEQRSRVRQALDGVVQHIRILDIDSSVFAEEVEPTGAIPMELSLERYRHAALPDRFQFKPKTTGDPAPGLVEGKEMSSSGSRVECARALPAVAVKPESRPPPPRHRIPEDLTRLNPRVETDHRPSSNLNRGNHDQRGLFHGSSILAALGQHTSLGYYEKVKNHISNMC